MVEVLRYFLEPLNPRGTIVEVEFWTLECHNRKKKIRMPGFIHKDASPRHKLSNDAMCCLEILHLFWGPNQANPMPVVLRPKPPNPTGVVCLLCFLHDLDTCHHLSSIARLPSPRAPAWLGQLPSRLAQTPYMSSPHVHLLINVPSVIHPRCILRPLVPQSKTPCSSFIISSPLARSHLTYPLSSSTISVFNTCAS